MKRIIIYFFTSLITPILMAGIALAEEGKVCIGCHRVVTPLMVKDSRVRVTRSEAEALNAKELQRVESLAEVIQTLFRNI